MLYMDRGCVAREAAEPTTMPGIMEIGNESEERDPEEWIENSFHCWPHFCKLARTRQQPAKKICSAPTAMSNPTRALPLVKTYRLTVWSYAVSTRPQPKAT